MERSEVDLLDLLIQRAARASTAYGLQVTGEVPHRDSKAAHALFRLAEQGNVLVTTGRDSEMRCRTVICARDGTKLAPIAVILTPDEIRSLTLDAPG